jgi:predicted nucleotidyltransferase
MKIVPVKLSDSLAEAIDALVKSGFYTSRNDVLRDAVRFLIESKEPKLAEERLRLQVELHTIARVVSAVLLNRYERVISKIVLFGSAVRGDVNEESDVDLLIIVRDGDRLEWRRKFFEEITSILYRVGRYVSIKTFTEREFRDLVDKESPFIKEVLSHGVFIYRTEKSG